MSNEGIAGRQCNGIGVLERGGGRGYRAICHVYQDLAKAPQTLKIPGKVLEFCPHQRGEPC